jgi:hypothetical protein
MTRQTFLAVSMMVSSMAWAAGPGDGVMGLGIYGGPVGAGVTGDPCDRGTSFTALKVVRAYRDNEAFAFKHLEGKQLDISGRLVAVKHDKIIVNNVLVFDGYVALVTPDGKPPKPVGLEFRFSIAALRADPQLACDVAALWPGQFVTLRGTCQGSVPEGDYVGVIFNDAQIAK